MSQCTDLFAFLRCLILNRRTGAVGWEGCEASLPGHRLLWRLGSRTLTQLDQSTSTQSNSMQKGHNYSLWHLTEKNVSPEFKSKVPASQPGSAPFQGLTLTSVMIFTQFPLFSNHRGASHGIKLNQLGRSSTYMVSPISQECERPCISFMITLGMTFSHLSTPWNRTALVQECQLSHFRDWNDWSWKQLDKFFWETQKLQLESERVYFKLKYLGFSILCPFGCLYFC